MSANEITVGYERKFSDGNYGSEGMSLSWSVIYEDDSDLAADPEVISARCHVIGTALREAVLSELRRSVARQVAFAAERELKPPAVPLGVPRYDEEGEEIPF